VSDQELQRLERFVLEQVGTGHSMSAEELLRAAEEKHVPATSSSLRWAILHLVSSGKLAFTQDYQLTAA
jgi:hypothetical protein